MSKKNDTKEVKLRAYRLVTENDTVTHPDVNLLDILPNDMTSTNFEDRLMLLSQLDEYSEKDTLAFLRDTGKGFHFGMMLRLRPVLQDGTLPQSKMKEKEIDLSDFLSGVSENIDDLSYKDHYYFGLSKDFLVVSFASSPRKLLTYLNWLIQDSTDNIFDFRSVMRKKMSEKAVVKNITYRPTSITPTNRQLQSIENQTITKKLNKSSASVIKEVFTDTEGLDEALENGEIKATLVVKFNRRALKKNNRNNFLQINTDNIENLEDFSIGTTEGTFSLAEIPYIVTYKSDITEKGFISDQQLIQEITKVMSDLKKNYVE